MMIKLEDICKNYIQGYVETQALYNINLEIKKGDFISIMGPSGSGKSSLLNILGLLDAPTSGNYFINGNSTNQLSTAQLNTIRREQIGFIFQDFNLIDDLSTQDNVELPMLYGKLSKKQRRIKIVNALEKLGLTHLTQIPVCQLSGGQQQQVAIARAIANSPAIIVADEPTGNLDSHQGRIVLDILSSLNRAGTTIVMATHSHQFATMSNRKIELLDGELLTEQRALVR